MTKTRSGKISVNTTDIFPIIKKWLYSEHDVFLRELIANGCDAITKRATLARTQNLEIPAGKVGLRVDKDKKTISISDNGVGMTEEEVEKYIARLAFSGAEEFVQKMEQAKGEDIIGKFGLGFYSAFMVAGQVVIDTLSMNAQAKAVRWTCQGETDYTFGESDRKEVGTTVTLHIGEQGKEFLDNYRLGESVRKFCGFLPWPIELAGEKEPQVLNETAPLWKRDSKELKDEQYKEFYRKLFPLDAEPLFWIHLKVDHPFTLEGVLYFPKVNAKINMGERNIRLYCKQMFVSDNVKDIIPEFLGLLKGAVDSPDIPLNVSRSSLQGDPNVRRISNYVVKKVAEALKRLFQKDRDKYQSIWPDIALFVKYGCISDEKFDQLMRDKVLFKNAKEETVNLGEYRAGLPADLKEKIGDKVLYFEAGKSDPGLVSELAAKGVYPLEVDDHIDPHFMQHAEFKKVGETTWKFAGVDGEAADLLPTEGQTKDDIKVKELFAKILSKGDKKVDIEIQKFKDTAAAAYFKSDEQAKRMNRMAQSMGQTGALPLARTLVVNSANELIQNALKIHQKGGNQELVEKICHHVEDLAGLSVDGLTPQGKEVFVRRSQELIKDLTGQLTA